MSFIELSAGGDDNLCRKTKKIRTEVMGRLQRVVLNCCLGGRLLVKFFLFSSILLDSFINDLSRKHKEVLLNPGHCSAGR